MNRRELEMHLQDLLEGCLQGEDLQALQEELRCNPDARDLYRDYVHLHNALQLRSDGIDLLHVVPMDRVIQRRQRRHLRSAVLAAAAVLLTSAIVAALIMINQPGRAHLTAAATADTRWTVDGQSQDPAADEWTIFAGSTVRVWSGTVKLRLESGVAMVVQGPAIVSFPDLDKPIVSSGWLWIDSAASDDPLEVTTPNLLLRDIGTRFGVHVPEEGPAEVHLIEGRVDVIARATEMKIVTLDPEQRGLAIATNDEPTGVPLARDPFPELAELLAEPANYPTTVRAQNPAGYWHLDETTKSGAVANEVPEGLTGLCDPRVTTHEAGPGTAGAFLGFEDGNQAIRLAGTPDRTPLSLGTATVHRGVLIHDDFNRKGPLHGTKPDVSTDGSAWVAAQSPSRFEADGSFIGRGLKTDRKRGGSATLAFTPVDGVVYTLDASLRDLKGGGYYVALGFADGQKQSAGKNCRFIGGEVTGRAWMLVYHESRENWPKKLRAAGSHSGTADIGPSTRFTSPDHADLDLRILLDTSKGPGRWTATWLAKQPGESNYTTVRSTEGLRNESISSVGLAVGGSDISGTVESFSLRAARKASINPGPASNAGPARVARREGAVSFWMRRETGVKRRELLWSAGDSSEDESIRALLTSDGRVGFFMENGRYDVLIASEDSVGDGEWHHLTASWSPRTVDLYLDGKRVARDTEYRAMQHGILSELRFGSSPAGSKAKPFTGWIDEIALWDRALTPAEVQHQFQSARRQEAP